MSVSSYVAAQADCAENIYQLVKKKKVLNKESSLPIKSMDSKRAIHFGILILKNGLHGKIVSYLPGKI